MHPETKEYYELVLKELDGGKNAPQYTMAAHILLMNQNFRALDGVKLAFKKLGLELKIPETKEDLGKLEGVDGFEKFIDAYNSVMEEEMTDEYIDKGNVTMALFDGWELHDHPVDVDMDELGPYLFSPTRDDFISVAAAGNATETNYHCNWSRIMRLLEKIQTQGGSFQINPNVCSIKSSDPSIRESVAISKVDTLSAVYMCLIDFINKSKL